MKECIRLYRGELFEGRDVERVGQKLEEQIFCDTTEDESTMVKSSCFRPT